MKNLDKIPIREPTHELTPGLATELTKHKKSQLKLQEEFMTEIIADEKDINDEIFWNYFSLSRSIACRKRLN